MKSCLKKQRRYPSSSQNPTAAAAGITSTDGGGDKNRISSSSSSSSSSTISSRSSERTSPPSLSLSLPPLSAIRKVTIPKFKLHLESVRIFDKNLPSSCTSIFSQQHVNVTSPAAAAAASTAASTGLISSSSSSTITTIHNKESSFSSAQLKATRLCQLLSNDKSTLVQILSCLQEEASPRTYAAPAYAAGSTTTAGYHGQPMQIIEEETKRLETKLKYKHIQKIKKRTLMDKLQVSKRKQTLVLYFKRAELEIDKARYLRNLICISFTPTSVMSLCLDTSTNKEWTRMDSVSDFMFGRVFIDGHVMENMLPMIPMSTTTSTSTSSRHSYEWTHNYRQTYRLFYNPDMDSKYRKERQVKIEIYKGKWSSDKEGGGSGQDSSYILLGKWVQSLDDLYSNLVTNTGSGGSGAGEKVKVEASLECTKYATAGTIQLSGSISKDRRLTDNTYRRKRKECGENIAKLVDNIKKFNKDLRGSSKRGGDDSAADKSLSLPRNSFNADISYFDGISLLHAAVYLFDLNLVKYILNHGGTRSLSKEAKGIGSPLDLAIRLESQEARLLTAAEGGKKKHYHYVIEYQSICKELKLRESVGDDFLGTGTTGNGGSPVHSPQISSPDDMDEIVLEKENNVPMREEDMTNEKGQATAPLIQKPCLKSLLAQQDSSVSHVEETPSNKSSIGFGAIDKNRHENCSTSQEVAEKKPSSQVSSDQPTIDDDLGTPETKPLDELSEDASHESTTEFALSQKNTHENSSTSQVTLNMSVSSDDDFVTPDLKTDRSNDATPTTEPISSQQHSYEEGGIISESTSASAKSKQTRQMQTSTDTEGLVDIRTDIQIREEVNHQQQYLSEEDQRYPTSEIIEEIGDGTQSFCTVPPMIQMIAPRENDVLFGRGNVTGLHKGNVYFRHIIERYAPEYEKATNNMSKNRIAGLVRMEIEELHPAGRFLQAKNKAYFLTTHEKTILEKIKQALRDRLKVNRNSQVDAAITMRTVEIEGAVQGVSVTEPKCSFWTQGCCPFGKKCVFSHDVLDERSEDIIQTSLHASLSQSRPLGPQYEASSNEVTSYANVQNRNTKVELGNNEDVMREEDTPQVEKDDEDDEDDNDIVENVFGEDLDTDAHLIGTRSSSRTNDRGSQQQERIQHSSYTQDKVADGSQQSRVCSSRHTAKTAFDEGSEQGAGLDERMSGNTKPFSEIAHDFDDLGFTFKVSKSTSISRLWVTRKECISGATGLKVFLPQVGDTVVYIPRAHFVTLEAYPAPFNSAGCLPWSLFPNTSSWPVVQCKVNDVRYRFPQNPKTIRTIVAIVRLTVIGIPVHEAERTIPWPSPRFVPQPSSRSAANIEFEVNVFDSEYADFIVPIDLYTWRITKLEEEINKSVSGLGGLNVIRYFADPEGDEDDNFEPFMCKTIASEEVVPLDQNAHLNRSGYNALALQYDDDTYDLSCPWEVSMQGAGGGPLPPCLTNEQKIAIENILDEIESEELVKVCFSYPPDTQFYCEYLNLIEVPMYISHIRERLSSDYYTNVHSVRADVKLIRDNCIKYNGGTDKEFEIVTAARKLYDAFSSLFETEVQRIGDDVGKREKQRKTDRIGTTESSLDKLMSRASKRSRISKASLSQFETEVQRIGDDAGRTEKPRITDRIGTTESSLAKRMSSRSRISRPSRIIPSATCNQSDHLEIFGDLSEYNRQNSSDTADLIHMIEAGIEEFSLEREKQHISNRNNLSLMRDSNEMPDGTSLLDDERHISSDTVDLFHLIQESIVEASKRANPTQNNTEETLPQHSSIPQSTSSSPLAQSRGQQFSSDADADLIVENGMDSDNKESSTRINVSETLPSRSTCQQQDSNLFDRQLPLWARTPSPDSAELLSLIEDDIKAQKRHIFNLNKTNVVERSSQHLSPPIRASSSQRDKVLLTSGYKRNGKKRILDFRREDIPTLLSGVTWAGSEVQKSNCHSAFHFVSRDFFDDNMTTIENYHIRFNDKELLPPDDADIFMKAKITGRNRKRWYTAAILDIHTGTVYNAKGGKCEERDGIYWYHTVVDAAEAVKIIIYTKRNIIPVTHLVTATEQKDSSAKPLGELIRSDKTWVLKRIHKDGKYNIGDGDRKEVQLHPFLNRDIVDDGGNGEIKAATIFLLSERGSSGRHWYTSAILDVKKNLAYNAEGGTGIRVSGVYWYKQYQHAVRAVKAVLRTVRAFGDGIRCAEINQPIDPVINKARTNQDQSLQTQEGADIIATTSHESSCTGKLALEPYHPSTELDENNDFENNVSVRTDGFEFETDLVGAPPTMLDENDENEQNNTAIVGLNCEVDPVRKKRRKIAADQCLRLNNKRKHDDIKKSLPFSSSGLSWAGGDTWPMCTEQNGGARCHVIGCRKRHIHPPLGEALRTEISSRTVNGLFDIDGSKLVVRTMKGKHNYSDKSFFTAAYVDIDEFIVYHAEDLEDAYVSNGIFWYTSKGAALQAIRNVVEIAIKRKHNHSYRTRSKSVIDEDDEKEKKNGKEDTSIGKRDHLQSVVSSEKKKSSKTIQDERIQETPNQEDSEGNNQKIDAGRRDPSVMLSETKKSSKPSQEERKQKSNPKDAKDGKKSKPVTTTASKKGKGSKGKNKVAAKSKKKNPHRNTQILKLLSKKPNYSQFYDNIFECPLNEKSCFVHNEKDIYSKKKKGEKMYHVSFQSPAEGTFVYHESKGCGGVEVDGKYYYPKPNIAERVAFLQFLLHCVDKDYVSKDMKISKKTNKSIFGS